GRWFYCAEEVRVCRHFDECICNRRPWSAKKGLKSNSLGGAGKRHSLGAGKFDRATATSGDQLSNLALTTRAAIRGDRSAAVTRLIFF
ncbi:MAG TPA: hypothetical protein VII37_06825, partial [Candidatus Acidoferrum sp.]